MASDVVAEGKGPCGECARLRAQVEVLERILRGAVVAHRERAPVEQVEPYEPRLREPGAFPEGVVLPPAEVGEIDVPVSRRYEPPPPRAAPLPRVTPKPHVYFIQQGEGGPIKIGVSKHPATRLASLQTASPHPLKLLATFPGDAIAEAELHQRFAALRLEGEWFQPGEELLAYIAPIRRTA